MGGVPMFSKIGRIQKELEEEKLETDDKDVKEYMIEYLTLDRPSGYGLEYY